MRRLGDVLSSRDNNFNLLRMAAASMVLVSHAFALTTGSGRSQPLYKTYGCTPGSIAVDIFFVSSGLLVTASLLRRRSALAFAAARVRRIWPGLAVVVLLTVFVLGPAFTTRPASEYFSAHQTWGYLLYTLTLFNGIGYHLPGVFETNPWKLTVNGSLWTLTYEVRAYAFLLLAWVAVARMRSGRAFAAVIATVFAGCFAVHIADLDYHTLEDSISRLYAFFFCGSALCVFARHVPLSHAGAAAAALVLATGAGHPPWFEVAYSFSLPYLVLWLAYVPGGWLRHYNRLGDYSYGTYIYAYPVQQIVAAARPGIAVWPMVALSAAATLALAVASWTLVERHAIEWRQRQRKQAPQGVASASR